MALTTFKPLDFEEYVAFDNGTDERYELVHGGLVLMNPPTGRHSAIIELIHDHFKAEIARKAHPWVSRRDIGVRVDINGSRLPDLCVMTLEQEQAILEVSAVLQSPPVLVVEVVSPSTATTDYRAKRSEYAVRGIPEYWIADPVETKVSVLILSEGFYDLVEFRDNEQIVSPTFVELTLSTAQIFGTARS